MRARSCLGTEATAQRQGKDLTAFFEQISGSDAYKQEPRVARSQALLGSAGGGAVETSHASASNTHPSKHRPLNSKLG